MRPRARTASGWPAQPEREPETAAGGDRDRARPASVGRASLDEQVRQALDRRWSRGAGAPFVRATVGRSGAVVVGAEDEAGAGARLLERLEQRVLGIGVEPLRGAR